MRTTTEDPQSEVMEVAERVFARDLRAHVDTYRALGAGVSVDVLEVGGGVAAFVGVGLPLTTVKGLAGDVTADELVEVEAFFRVHRVPVVTVELAPWADASTRDRLVARGYEVAGTEDVVVTRTVAADPVDRPSAALEVIWLGVDEMLAISRQGFEQPIDPSIDELLGVSARLPGTACLGVRAGGRVIACGQVVVDDDAVIFGNDTTVPDARRLGGQTALIQARLALTDTGALAIAEVAPDSGSERNYVRCGFEIAYTRALFTRHLG
jgi:hypothetical protein